MGKWAWFLKISAVLGALSVLVSCGNSSDAGSGAVAGSVGDVQVFQTVCPAGVAQVGVGNGISQVLCGCQEAAGTMAQAPNPLTCTVAAGTLVVFHYTSANLDHQIRTNTPGGLEAGPVQNSGDKGAGLRLFPVKFDSPGTFTYEDSFNSAVHGQIVVL